MTTLTREQVLQIIEAARVKGEMPKLFGADLAETERRQAQLGGAKLSQADLHRGSLRELWGSLRGGTDPG